MPFGAELSGPIVVLYVEDDEALATLVRKALRRRGHTMAHVSNSADALARIASAPETAFRDEKDRGVIAYVVVALHGANHAVNDQLTEAIGLVMGFNALDGD